MSLRAPILLKDMTDKQLDYYKSIRSRASFTDVPPRGTPSRSVLCVATLAGVGSTHDVELKICTMRTCSRRALSNW